MYNFNERNTDSSVTTFVHNIHMRNSKYLITCVMARSLD